MEEMERGVAGRGAAKKVIVGGQRAMRREKERTGKNGHIALLVIAGRKKTDIGEKGNR